MQSEKGNELSSQNANPPPPSNQQTGPFPPDGPPVYYPSPVYMRPKIPGKALGSASLILGCLGSLFSIVLILIALLAVLYGSIYHVGLTESLQKFLGMLFGAGDFDAMQYVFSFIVMSLVLTILACVFAVVSRKRGYRSGISKAGFLISLVSFALIATVIVFFSYACPGIWAV